MKKTIFAAILVIVLAGCTQNSAQNTPKDMEKEIMRQMEEAEKHFDATLSAQKISDVYPNRIIVKQNQPGETWPVFFNAENAEKEVKIEVQCSKEFETEQSTGYFKVPPKEHKSFAIKLRPTGKTGKGYALCDVTFVSNDAVAAKNGFVAIVE